MRMRWVRPVGTRLVRYGPQAQLAWRYAGRPAMAGARRAMDAAMARRSAIRHADTLRDGAVLRVVDAGRQVWVAFSGSTPVAAYPTPTIDLAALVAHADLEKMRTPAQMRRSAADRAQRVSGLVRSTGGVIQRTVGR